MTAEIRTWEISCTIGTLYAEVEAESENQAIDIAIEQWVDDADSIIGEGTFRAVSDE